MKDLHQNMAGAMAISIALTVVSALAILASLLAFADRPGSVALVAAVCMGYILWVLKTSANKRGKATIFLIFGLVTMGVSLVGAGLVQTLTLLTLMIWSSRCWLADKSRHSTLFDACVTLGSLAAALGVYLWTGSLLVLIWVYFAGQSLVFWPRGAQEDHLAGAQTQFDEAYEAACRALNGMKH